MSVLVITKTPV